MKFDFKFNQIEPIVQLRIPQNSNENNNAYCLTININCLSWQPLHCSTFSRNIRGENRIMLCAAKMFCAACRTKHHPLKSMEDNRRF